MVYSRQLSLGIQPQSEQHTQREAVVGDGARWRGGTSILVPIGSRGGLVTANKSISLK